MATRDTDSNRHTRRGPRHRLSGQSPVEGSDRVRVSARCRGDLVDRPYVRVSPTGCWLWQRAKDTTGYGRLWSNDKLCPAHRVVYEGMVGQIPAGLNLDHLCGVRACVNPAHLEPVTQATNIRRSSAAKLTLSAVSEIRRRAAQGGTTYTAIARDFGVTDRNVSFIVHGLTWVGDL